MEIGVNVTWESANKRMEGLFLQEDKGIAEVICYKMGNANCRLRVFVDVNKLTEI